jgi:hypothetical protein
MNLSDKYEKLMEYIYDQYNKSESFRIHGEHAGILVDMICACTDIKLSDVKSREEALIYLHKQGWIDKEQEENVNRCLYNNFIKLTDRGIEFAKSKRKI